MQVTPLIWLITIAVTILAEGVSVTVHGRAVIERELERIAVVRVDDDHRAALESRHAVPE